MTVMETCMKALSKMVEPCLRVPFVIVIDWYFEKLDLSNLGSVLRFSPGFLILLPFLFFGTVGNYLFTYGFLIILNVAILGVYIVLGAYLPWLELEDLMTSDVRKFYVDGLMFYQFLIFMMGLNNNSIHELHSVYKTLLFAIMTAILSHVSWGFVVGFWYYLASEMFDVHKKLKTSFKEAVYFVKNFGYVSTVVYFYQNKKISLVLRLFWLVAMVASFISQKQAKFNLMWFFICLGSASNSSLRLFSLALWIPEISFFILWSSQAILKWSINHTVQDMDQYNIGNAFIFFFIASFNAILHVELIQRIFIISLLFFICFSYIMQSVHKLCDETLMGLSTSTHPNLYAHVRTILLTLCLIWALVYVSWIFCYQFQFQTWQLVIVSTNIVTCVQTLSTLAIYALFMYDLRSRNNLENLDDWVYYLNAISKLLEFLSAFLLLGFGLWDIIQGSWSIFGLLIIIVHSYHNVWVAGMNGWKTFLSRRNAMKKLKQLSDATKDELENLQDLCAICFESMSSAKVTQCGHYFHASCLQKWLYRQSTCPLCHKDILLISNEKD